MEINFEREPLFNEVWQLPMTSLARKYGLSDNGLRKVCKALEIPLPPVGYWAKIAAGGEISKPALPKTDGPTTFVSRPPAQEHPYADPSDESWLVKQLEYEDLEETAIKVDLQPKRWHEAVEKIQSQLTTEKQRFTKALAAFEGGGSAKFNPERFGVKSYEWFWFMRAGQVLCSSHKRMAMRVSPGTCDRALAIVNAIFQEAERRGYKVKCEEEFERFVVEVRETPIRFRLVERQAEEIRDVDGRPEKVKFPTGTLVLFIGEQYLGERQITESSDSPLEHRINDAFKSIYRRVVRERDREREREAWNRAYEEKLRLAAEERRRKEAEARASERERRRKTALLVEAKKWRDATLIREYVSYKTTISGSVKTPELEEWASWALRAAHELDPAPR
jgi:hypothetical protein